MAWLDPNLERVSTDWSTFRSNRRYTFSLVAVLTVLVYTFWIFNDGGYNRQDLERLMGISSPESPPEVVDADGWPIDLDSSNTNMVPGSGTQLDQHKSADQEYAPPKAVIIETDVFPALIPIMTHFAAVLGSSWGIILYTLEANWVEPTSWQYTRLRQEGRLEVRFLPSNTTMAESRHVSEFLTRPWLWEQLADLQRVLIFQSDSMICSNSAQRMEDWLQWDMVGAPIDPNTPFRGYNGGLSIRNPRAILNITQTVDFAKSDIRDEDRFFFAELEKVGALLPTINEAMPFSVETIYYEKPLGYHQYNRWLSHKAPEIEQWCPEVKLATGRRTRGPP